MVRAKGEALKQLCNILKGRLFLGEFLKKRRVESIIQGSGVSGKVAIDIVIYVGISNCQEIP